MFHIELYQTAIADLQDGYDWYQEQLVGLGERFAREVDHCLDLICENPYQFAVQFSGKYRFALLHHFPFRIVYSIDERQNYVFVTAIFHTSREPKRF